jgi:radical SAM family uncharacterized protein/radical SAM-linked protein
MKNRGNIQDILKKVEKPGRYLGGEWNAKKKDPSRVKTKVALAFPDIYEVGMSYLGQKILYGILNSHSSILAERVFAPWMDMERELKENGIPLFSLENRIPLYQFDIVGFSLLYELNYSNVLNMMELGRVPMLAKKRGPDLPLVIAGGPASFNPEPIADFFDIFLIGDGEEAFLEIIEAHRNLKNSGAEKAKILGVLAGIKGVYVPLFYDTYQPKKSLLLAVKPQDGKPAKVKKRILYPFCHAPFPENIVVPNINVIFDRVAVEAARGCPQKCRFCQAANIYFPPRVKSPSAVIKGVLNSLRSTGYEDVSLASLSISDYPYLKDVMKTLMKRLETQKVSLSLSSLRPSGLTSEVVETIRKVRKTGFTLVPEAGTERLRRVINKDLKDEEIWQAANNAFSQGWKLLKLYFMIGLPTEREEDLKGMVDMVREILRLGKRILGRSPQINLSISSFIPKPHTPFQWLPMEEKTNLRNKLKYVLTPLKHHASVRVKRQSLESSILEGIFSRGDRKLNAVLLKAWEMGARFESWGDRLSFPTWEKAFETEGVDYRAYLSGLDLKSTLPWDHIDTGIKKRLLRDELNLAMMGKSSPTCLERDCSECKGCTASKFYQDKFEEGVPVLKDKISFVGKKTDKIHRYLASYAKKGNARFLSHLDIDKIIQQGFKKANFSVSYSQGFHPKMLISFPPALPLGMEGKAEWVEFKSSYLLTEQEFLTINIFLPSGVKFLSLQKMADTEPSLSKKIKTLVYSLDLKEKKYQKAVKGFTDESEESRLLEAFQKYVNDFIKESTGNSVEKAVVDGKNGKFYIYIKHGAQGGLKPQEIVKEIFCVQNPVYDMSREKIVFHD